MNLVIRVATRQRFVRYFRWFLKQVGNGSPLFHDYATTQDWIKIPISSLNHLGIERNEYRYNQLLLDHELAQRNSTPPPPPFLQCSLLPHNVRRGNQNYPRYGAPVLRNPPQTLRRGYNSEMNNRQCSGPPPAARRGSYNLNNAKSRAPLPNARRGNTTLQSDPPQALRRGNVFVNQQAPPQVRCGFPSDNGNMENHCHGSKFKGKINSILETEDLVLSHLTPEVTMCSIIFQHLLT